MHKSTETLDNICSTKSTLQHFQGVPLAHACRRPWKEIMVPNFWQKVTPM